MRVFLVENDADLEHSALRRQLAEDILSGFKVYLCRMDKVRGSIGAIDFGIWDDEYVCIVSENDGPEPDILLTSRQEDIPQAQQWKEIIMKEASPVTSLDDVERWAQADLATPS